MYVHFCVITIIVFISRRLHLGDPEYHNSRRLHHSRSLGCALSHSKIPPRSMKVSGSHPASAREASTPTFSKLFPGTFFPPWQLRNLDEIVSLSHSTAQMPTPKCIPHFFVQQEVRVLHSFVIFGNESILLFLWRMPVEECLELTVCDNEVFGVAESVGTFILAF